MFWEYDGKFIREIPINWLSFPLADFPTLNILHNFCLLVPNSTKLLKVSENVKLPYINATPLEHRSKQILLLKCVKPFELFWCTHVRSLSALINGSKAILESYSSNFLKLVKKNTIIPKLYSKFTLNNSRIFYITITLFFLQQVTRVNNQK